MPKQNIHLLQFSPGVTLNAPGGTLPGSISKWDLGTQQVQVFPGPPGSVLPTSGQVAAAVLCIEEQGSNSC